MILTTKGRYAVMAIIDLYETSGIGQNAKPISLSSISQRQNISLSYLEQIFANLRKSDIITSIKGPGGGYILAKSPEKITISDIIFATGENIKMTSCSNSSGVCSVMKEKNGKKKCRTHNLWKGLETNIITYLNSISIYDICNKINY